MTPDNRTNTLTVLAFMGAVVGLAALIAVMLIFG